VIAENKSWMEELVLITLNASKSVLYEANKYCAGHHDFSSFIPLPPEGILPSDIHESGAKQLIIFPGSPRTYLNGPCIILSLLSG
jgi:hypothetical protein